jgi:hypothetical protein
MSGPYPWFVAVARAKYRHAASSLAGARRRGWPTNLYEIGVKRSLDELWAAQEKAKSMKKPVYTVTTHYMNGSSDNRPFASFRGAALFCCESISYTGERVRRVEIKGDLPSETPLAVWDISWTDLSKAAGLAALRGGKASR